MTKSNWLCRHFDCRGHVCSICFKSVDSYGNTEEEQEYCSFPDCGCDGARLCCATGGPSRAAEQLNMEKRR